MKKITLLLSFTFLCLHGYSQCSEMATNFGNNAEVPMYNVTGDITLTLNTDDTITLDLGANFMTAPGPDIRAYLVNSNGVTDATLITSKIADLESIQFGLVGAIGTLDQNGAKTFTVPIPANADIADFDRVFFYCLQFDQFWDFGSFIPFTSTSCSVLSVTDVFKASNLTVYPNPTSDKIKLLNVAPETGKIRVYDALGKMVYQQNKNLDKEINVSHLTPGIYMLKIDAQGKVKNQKLVIQ